MQIQGTHTFQAPKQVVWDALMDPTILAMALPGGEALEKISENEYKAAMKVRVGPVQGKFDGGIELTDINLLDSYRMKVSGQGSPGFVNGEGNVQLEESGTATIMHYSGDVQVGGKIASVGQRLIDSTAKAMIRQGLVVLDAQIAILAANAAAIAPPVAHPVEPAPAGEVAATASPAPETPVAPAVPVAAVAAPTMPRPVVTPVAAPSTAKMATEVAKDVARDLVSDVIPLKFQEKLLWFALGAVAMLILQVIF